MLEEVTDESGTIRITGRTMIWECDDAPPEMDDEHRTHIEFAIDATHVDPDGTEYGPEFLNDLFKQIGDHKRLAIWIFPETDEP